MFAHEKIHGIDRERLLAAVEPVLRAHHVEGVELVWKTDSRGWVLQLTVERPGSERPGEGVTLDLCSEISRDLSHALDVADVIPVGYRLEVGSPGLDRALYGSQDYRRFRGKLAKLKLRSPRLGQYVLRGTLFGLDEQGRVVIDTDTGEEAVPVEEIESANLVLDLAAAGFAKGSKNASKRRPKAAGKAR